MVAHLLRLKLTLLRNSVRRSPWQLVGLGIGILYALGLVALGITGLLFLRGADAGVAQTVVVLGGAAALLGWAVVPVAASAADLTLDPARFTTFAVPMPQLLAGLALGGLIGIPGTATTLVALGTVGTWSRSLPGAAGALIGAVLGVLSCIVLSKVVTTATAGLAASRRFKDASAVIFLIPLVLMGPIVAGVAEGIAGSGDFLTGLARTLSWTPAGAAWSLGGELAAGSYGAAALKFLIAVATLAGLALCWKLLLQRALVTPPYAGASRKRAGGLGFFGLFPATPTGAVAARSLSYWLRDPRYAGALVVVPLLPVLLLFQAAQTGSYGMLLFVGPLTAFLLAWSISTDVSYDNTAFALHLSTGVRGVHDRLGRAVACLVFALPAVLALSAPAVPVRRGRPAPARCARAVPRRAAQRDGTVLGGIGALHRRRAASRGQPLQETAGERGADHGGAVRRHGRPDPARAPRNGAAGGTVRHRQCCPRLDQPGPRPGPGARVVRRRGPAGREMARRPRTGTAGPAGRQPLTRARRPGLGYPAPRAHPATGTASQRARQGPGTASRKGRAMEVVILSGSKPIAALAADAIEALLRRRPDAVLGLATGSSPLPVYNELALRHERDGLDFSRVRGFALDEYVGLPPGHPESYREVIRREFTERVNIDPANVLGPDGSAADIPAACRSFEDALRGAGGVDLQLLGVGTDGHLAFNEPGSSLASRTRIKTLIEQTRRDNARFFGSLSQVPHHVVTQGLGTILEARHVILIATGAQKAQAVRDLVEGPVAAICPASVLQLHPHATILLDEAAASSLRLADYYRHSYENKPSWQGL